MKIFIANTHSILNSGDAGIVLAQIQFLKKHFPAPELFLSSRTPELDKEFYGSEGVKIFPPIIPAPSIYSGKSHKILSSLKNLVNIRSTIALIRAIKQSHLVISSGGGYFWSHRKFIPGPMFFQNYLHLRLAVLFRKPVLFFPQSFDPLHSKMATRLLKRLLQNRSISKIFVREQPSRDYLTKILGEQNKIEPCPDMAFILGDRDQPLNSRSIFEMPNPTVALTLRQWDFPEAADKQTQKSKQASYLESLFKACVYIYREWGGSIITFCQSRGPGHFEDDRIITQEFIQRLQESVPATHFRFVDLPESAHPKEIIAILRQVDFLIATRFHSAIFALIVGVPVISLSYQHKSSGIMESLGLESFHLDIADFDSDKIIQLGESIISHSEDIRSKINKNVLDMRKKIESTLIPSIQPFLSMENHEDTIHK